MFSHNSPQPNLAPDSIAVPTNSPEQVRRNAVLADWANVGISADLMRPHAEERLKSALGHAEARVGQQQSYCCR